MCALTPQALSTQKQGHATELGAPNRKHSPVSAPIGTVFSISWSQAWKGGTHHREARILRVHLCGLVGVVSLNSCDVERNEVNPRSARWSEGLWRATRQSSDKTSA